MEVRLCWLLPDERAREVHDWIRLGAGKGVSPVTLSLYERGQRDLSPATYVRLVEAWAALVRETAA